MIKPPKNLTPFVYLTSPTLLYSHNQRSKEIAKDTNSHGIDLTQLTPEQLDVLEQDIPKERERRLNEARTHLRQHAEQLARELGLTADDLLQQEASVKTRTTRNTRKSTPPKYQNPDNPAETWAGRGKRPAWVKAKLEAGMTLADMEIT